MAYDVESMECRVTQLGTIYAGTTAPAGSQWCLVRLTVTNVGTSPTIYTSGGTAFDSMGDKFSSDEEAEPYVSDAFGVTLNPGVTISDVVPFQLSMTDSLSRMEFSSFMTPGSVSVPLG
jgi:hypothetical protein